MWKRSSYCNADSPMCVEVLTDIDAVRVRDSKAPETVLTFTRFEWDAFVFGVKAGDFDL